MIRPDLVSPARRLLSKILTSVQGAPLVRRPPRCLGRSGLRVHRCSGCDHPLFEAWLAPDAEWFVLCPHCRADRRAKLRALVAAFVLGGLLALFLQG